MNFHYRLAVAVVIATICAAVDAAATPEYNGVFHRMHDHDADGIIVRWSRVQTDKREARLQKASHLAGQRIIEQKSLDENTDVLRFPQPLSDTDLSTVLRQLEADPDVVYAAPDLRRHAHAVTSDPLLPTQWYLLSEQASATRTESAWDMTTGSPDVIVAVLDTGVRFDHPDLGRMEAGGKLLAGYDFVSRVAVANDGDARDPDPSDPGDWVDSTDRTQPDFGDCDLSQSSWHGTRVSGLIGALTNNADGIAGAAFNTRILPVRVLGKCGGFDSDIIAAMRWAAGLSVSGIPANPTPANIINLSLGGDGVCTTAYQSTVDEVTARGVVVVVSAGNEGGPVGSPANCAGVLGVAGIRHVGTKVGFSNLGPEVSVGAPGGNCVNTGSGQPCLFSIVVASNTGTTVPAAPTYTDQFRFNVGTSFSAPQAAAAVALMQSVNRQLSPAQLITLVKRSSSQFPVSADSSVPTCHIPASSSDLQAAECNCTTQTCGAGMLNTGAAVAAAQRPFAVLRTSGTVASGSTIVLEGSSSVASNGRSLTTFQWTIENLTGPAPVIAAASQPTTTVRITGTSDFVVRLTVTDDQGGQDSDVIALATPVTPPAQPGSSGNGGGGSFTWELLALLGMLASRVLEQDRRSRFPLHCTSSRRERSRIPSPSSMISSDAVSGIRKRITLP